MTGRLVLVSGISGAGKTTLIRHAVTAMPNLEYLQTTTTRPKRNDDTDTIEYNFVTDDNYETLKKQSSDWDHTDYNGFKYGADIAHVKRVLAKGKHVICAIAPDFDVVQSMKHLYGVDPALLWIDTPTLVAKQRVANDSVRASRDENESVKQHFQHVFRPKGNLDEDQLDFLAVLQNMLK